MDQPMSKPTNLVPQPQLRPAPSPPDFFLNAPLYQRFKGGIEAIKAVYHFGGTMDAFCRQCGKDSVYVRDPDEHYLIRPNSDPPIGRNDIHVVTMVCPRNHSHKLRFVFHGNAFGITKIGQYPAFAELHSGRFNRYRSVLGAKHSELVKAVGLVSHDAAIGGFLYLRRIFEHLVAEAHQVACKEAEWDEPKYRQSRMDDKVMLLGRHLPSKLAELKPMYGILSKGIHELTEEDCRLSFPVVLAGTEMILQSMIRDREQAKQDAETRKAVTQLHEALKQKG